MTLNRIGLRLILLTIALLSVACSDDKYHATKHLATLNVIANCENLSKVIGDSSMTDTWTPPSYDCFAELSAEVYP